MAIEIPEELSSGRPERRRVAWRKIKQQNREEERRATQTQLRELGYKFTDEPNDDVKKVALEVLIGLLSCGTDQRKTPSTKLKLADWFWRPFHNPSLVISAFDPEYRRRDEIAVTDLARHLPKKDFPNAEFRVIPLGYADWGDVLKTDRDIGAVCIIGRLGMFGLEAVREWDTNKTRLRFPTHDRPQDLCIGELNPDFHRIEETHGPAGNGVAHIAHEDDRERTDFGLIQRYSVWFDTRPTTVVLCAGCSGLGTFGAVQWMIELMKSPIELPKEVSDDACFEALIEVKADVAPFPRHWQPKPKRLLNLYLGDHQWSQDTQEWLIRAPFKIRVIYDRDGHADGVLLDGQPTGPRRDAVIFRLLVKLAELTAAAPGESVKISSLAAMGDIWGSKPTNETNARRRAGQLRRQYLGRALSISESSLRLDAKVDFDRP
ncbi:MAG: hypothetical protein H8E44_37895 [Planctomycetes bacterium]|nr:hypothetical protein [Planctomycetota bacterium]MBL7040756.1 hypothetical protein [Pirellulaceae bacterium]